MKRRKRDEATGGSNCSPPLMQAIANESNCNYQQHHTKKLSMIRMGHHHWPSETCKSVIKNDTSECRHLRSLLPALCWILLLTIVSCVALEQRQHNHIVFPDHATSGEATTANQRSRHGHQPVIYINPQPSTLSGKYQTGESVNKASPSSNRRQAAPGFYQPPIGSRGAHSARLLGPSSSPSSIGKSEKSLVAEWPFFKSFQTVRNSQMSNQLQALPSTTIQPTTVAIDKQIGFEQQIAAASPRAPSSSQNQRTTPEPSSTSGAPVRDDSDAGTTTTPEPSTASTPGMPALPNTGSTSAEDEANEPSDSSGKQQNDAARMVTPTGDLTRTVAITTTTSTTTTTAGPPAEETTTTTAPRTPTTIRADLADQMLMAPKMHSSIQQAVNRLVEMSGVSKSASNARDIGNSSQQSSDDGATASSLPANKQAAPTVMRLNGNSNGLRSSLSLNVLLKNFGAFNLSSLDQILLKSSLNENATTRQGSLPLPLDQGRIAINGIHHQQQSASERGLLPVNVADGKLATDANSNQTDSAEAMAECKIEYTMKHVNISLMNDDRSDYTCDYIIDRKLSAAHSSVPLLDKKICKLQLRSEFFSNESSTTSSASADADICSGSTYLSIGSLKFCHLLAVEQETASLNRVFNFPIEHEAFDIRLVHKTKRKAMREPMLMRKTSGEQNDDEIHLELKPVVDEANDCHEVSSRQYQSPNRVPAQSTILSAPIMRNNPRDLSVARQDLPEISSSNKSTGGINSNNNPKWNSISKLELDRQSAQNLNPRPRLNQPSQYFDLGTRHANATNLANPFRQKLHKLATSINGETPSANEVMSQCLDMVHVATVGQIQTPNYPQNYTANMRCRHIIKRVSPNHCKLLLHFRDFDLVPAQDQARAQGDTNHENGTRLFEDCRGDYLLIGETRYCNKYAMIGHKMYLNFSDAIMSELNDEAIALTFISDGQASGRGALIKYQQLSTCHGDDGAGSQISIDSKNNFKNITGHSAASSSIEPAAKLHTLAPPIQQPDFSLALRKAAEQDSPTGANVEFKSRNSSSGQRGKNEKSQKLTDAQGANKRAKQLAPPRATNSSANNDTTPGLQLSSPSQPQLLQMASTSGSQLLFADTPTTSATTRSLDQQESAAAARPGSSPSRACNSINHELQFLLTSHNYPNAYENNLACMHFVRRNSSKVCYLELTFLRFDLEADSDCRYDYLEINNVRLCGSLQQSTTRIYLFEEAVKLIKFKTDSSGSKGGFLLRAEQLECRSDGSILRAGSTSGDGGESWPSSSLNDDTLKRGSKNASVFEYDSVLGQSKSGQQVGGLEQPLTGRSSLSTTTPSSGSRQLNSRRFHEPDQAQQTARQCDYLLHGRDITIRSPMWPESYAQDELLGSCRYTILRQNFGGPKKSSICQLELRFVHLRLGPGDCLDIDGMELLCGFNVRNLVKYYPFNERQTHLTITFSTASGTAKLFSARSATPPYQHQTAALLAAQQQQQNHSDLLPTVRGPLRFMIIARQLECIDDFLAPQVELDQPSSSSSSSGGPNLVNSTNLLYSNEAAGAPSLPPARPRYVNRTGLPNTGSAHIAKPTVAAAARPHRVKANESQLSYDQSPTIDLDPIQLTGGLSPATTTSAPNASHRESPSSGGVLMYSFANSVSTSGQAGVDLDSSCLVQFNQYNGILASSNILQARAGSSSKSSECEIRLKLLPGFCKIQLSFGEFDLYPARLGGSLCLGEHLELAGVQYCGHELKNSTRLLSTTLPGQRHISLRATHTSHNSFRAIFKQLECDQPTLPATPISGGNSQSPAKGRTSSSSSATTTTTTTSSTTSVSSADRRSIGSKTEPIPVQTSAIDFREIVMRSEFFELNSNKLSKFSSLVYDPNMFVIYKLKKAHPSVCKVRLMFYKFDLEHALGGTGGCKRDFLDINNQDRLCGTMDFRHEESSREYDWPVTSGADFQISFVSDSLNQRTGFHLFGQQVRCEQEGATRGGQAGAAQSTAVSMDSQITNEKTKSSPERDEQNRSRETTSGLRGGGPVSAKSDSRDGSGHKQHLPSNCSQIVDGEHFQLASPGWPDRYDGLGTCHYLIRRARPDVCSLTLGVNSMILDINSGSQSVEGVCGNTEEALEEDRLELDEQVKMCGLITRPRSYTFDFANSTSQRQFIMVKFVSNLSRGFGFHIEGRQNACNDTPATLKSNASKPVNTPNRITPKTTSGESTHREQHTDSGNNQAGVYQISYDDSPPVKQHQQTEAGPGSFSSSSLTKTNDEQQPPVTASEKQQPADAVKQLDGDPARQDDPDSRPPDGGQERKTSCNRLLTGATNLIESEHFPEHYANNLDCLYAVRRINQSVCAIDLVFNYFDLEPPSAGSSVGSSFVQSDDSTGVGPCESDFLEIDYSRFCGAYPSQHRLRFNYYRDELDKIIRFKSDAARTRIGFSIVVNQVMGDDECNRSSELNSDNLSQQKSPPSTRQRPAEQEGGAEREVISYLPDSTSSSSVEMSAANSGHDHHHAKTTPANQNNQSPHQQVVASDAGQPSATLCQFSYRNERQLLVSPGYNPQRNHYDNNLQCTYKIIAASYEICALRLTIIDLDLEKSTDCSNDYLLIDSQRYCGTLQQADSNNRSRKSIELEFDANLPREIDLIFNTDSHASIGRGFKILAEQVACLAGPSGGSSSAMTDQEFRFAAASVRGDETLETDQRGADKRGLDAESVARARQVRRMRFGQLSYPQNYVSSPVAASPANQAAPSDTTTRVSRTKQLEPTTTIASAPPDDHRRRPATSPAAATGRPARQQKQLDGNNDDDQFVTISSDDLKLTKEIVVTRAKERRPA